MKKFSLFLIIAAAVFLGSCSNEMPSTASSESGHFILQLPQTFSTRAKIGEKPLADKLVWALYDDSGKMLACDSISDAFGDGGVQEVNVRMHDDESYKLVFYASCSSGRGVHFDTQTGVFGIDYKNINVNSVAQDVFYATLSGTPEEMGQEVSLKRPFAQLNIGTADVANAAGDADGLQSFSHNIRIKGDLLTQLSLLDTSMKTPADGNALNVDFDFGEMQVLNGDDEKFPVDGCDGIGMLYLLVAPTAEGQNESVDITYNINKEGEAQPYRSFELSTVPVAANSRTNIYGNLLTTTETPDVNIDDDFGGSVDIKYETVTSADDLIKCMQEGIPALVPDGVTLNMSGITSLKTTNYKYKDIFNSYASGYIVFQKDVDIQLDGVLENIPLTFIFTGNVRIHSSKGGKISSLSSVGANLKALFYCIGLEEYITSLNQVYSDEIEAGNISVGLENISFTGPVNGPLLDLRYLKSFTSANCEFSNTYSANSSCCIDNYLVVNTVIDNCKLTSGLKTKGMRMCSDTNIEIKNSEIVTSEGIALLVDYKSEFNCVENAVLNFSNSLFVNKGSSNLVVSIVKGRSGFKNGNRPGSSVFSFKDCYIYGGNSIQFRYGLFAETVYYYPTSNSLSIIMENTYLNGAQLSDISASTVPAVTIRSEGIINSVKSEVAYKGYNFTNVFNGTNRRYY